MHGWGRQETIGTELPLRVTKKVPIVFPNLTSLAQSPKELFFVVADRQDSRYFNTGCEEGVRNDRRVCIDDPTGGELITGA